MPIKELPLIKGKGKIENNKLIINGKEFPISMGTGVLIASAIKILEYFNEELPTIITAGDIGEGNGSLKIYEELKNIDDDIVVIHYIKPKISAIKEIDFSPKIIGDAGGMYAGKAANIGDKFYLFLPDVGELAFLADEKSYHPAYVRGFISETDDVEVPKLIDRACKNNKMPKYMLVKGKTDYIVENGNIVSTVGSPLIEAMECIGGTGDTLTGLVSSLINCGYDTVESCILGSKINRTLGEYINATPKTQIEELIMAIPDVLKIMDL